MVRENKMEKLYLKNNNEQTTDKLYESRENMKNNLYSSLSENYKPMVYDHFFEVPFYGRVDKNGNSVFPSEKFLKEVKSANGNFLFVHDFVRDAYNELESYYKKGLLTNKLKTTNSPYTSLNPKKAFSNSNKLYSDYLNRFSSIFVQYVRKNGNKDILNFKAFVNKLIDFLSEQPGEVLLTRASFLKSKLCDQFISGFSISLMQDQYDNDKKKLETYLSDNNFSFFVDTCKRHCFSIDSNAPWVIHFDFNSPAAQKYLQKYNIQDYNDLLEKRFYKSYLTDLKLLKTILQHMYSVYLAVEPTEDIIVGINNCKTPVFKKIVKKEVTSVETEYSDFEWLRLYLDIRMLEEALVIKAAKYKHAVLDIQNILRYGDGSGGNDNFTASLEYINNFVNKSIQVVKPESE